MVSIYVDADGCPVREEAMRVAARHGLMAYLVTDGGIRPPASPLVRLVIVAPGENAADDWIAGHIQCGDICVTGDIPLAARCLACGALALRPDGRPFTEDGIGAALADRALMRTLRESGAVTGGPKPFGKADRSAFLDRLEVAVQAAKRGA